MLGNVSQTTSTSFGRQQANSDEHRGYDILIQPVFVLFLILVFFGGKGSLLLNAGDDSSRWSKSSTAGPSGVITTESIFADSWYLKNNNYSGQVERFLETKQVLPLNIMTERAPTSSPECRFQSVVFPDPCRFASDKESGPVGPKSGFSKEFLPWFFGHLVAEYLTETEKRRRWEEEQDRPIIFRRCTQLRVGSWESKQCAAQRDGKTRTVYKAAQ
jgi:hypothetical protein